MAFYQPARQRRDVNPQLLIVIAAVILLMISFWAVASLVRQRSQDRFAPDSIIATTAATRPAIATKASHPGERQFDPVSSPGSSGARELKSRITYADTKPGLTAAVSTNAVEEALRDRLKASNAPGPGHYSEIPRGTHLLGLSVENRTVTVNLSKEFASGGGSTSMIGRVAELQKAVTGVNKHYKLKIAINGKPVPYLGGEGLELE